MQTLTPGSFLNLENDEKVEALKLTARRLAEHTANVVTENLNASALENLADNLWDKAKYVALDVERRRLRDSFAQNFTERFRELKPEDSKAEIPNLESLPAAGLVQNADFNRQSPALEIAECDDGENAAVPSSSLPQKSATEVEGKTDEFLGFVQSGEPSADGSVAETDASPFLPEESVQSVARPANEMTAEVSKAEKQFVSDAQTPNVDGSRVIADVLTENPPGTKSQTEVAAAGSVAKSSSQAVSADKPSAQAADGGEPFEFGKCTINLNLILLPSSAGGNGRKAIISTTSHKLPPEVELLEIGEAEDLTKIAALVQGKLERFKQTLPVKYIEQLRASKTKTAKKAANAKASTTVSAPTEPPSNQANAEKPSDRQHAQDLSGTEFEKSRVEITATKEIAVAAPAPVAAIQQSVAANNVQPSLF